MVSTNNNREMKTCKRKIRRLWANTSLRQSTKS